MMTFLSKTISLIVRQSIILALLAASLAPLANAADDSPAVEVLLRNGTSIKARLLQERPDRIDLDLGFSLLAVPRAEVAQAKQDAGKTQPTPTGPVSRGLYSVDPDRRELNVRENVDRCGAGVVQIRTATGLGSGFLIDNRGHVVTNNHVVSGEQAIRVQVYDTSGGTLRRNEFNKVRIVATSPLFDLALLQIEDAAVAGVPFLPIGDSELLSQGQPVFAIGSPLGLERTVSQGIVSLRNREIDGRVYIQTTVQINPGNSGGPLLNLRGEVVGVNNMKAALVGVEGLAFDIPASVLKFFLANVDAYAFDPRNPNSGFRYNQPPGAPSL